MISIPLTSWHGGFRNISYIAHEEPPPGSVHFDKLAPAIQEQVLNHFDYLDKTRQIVRSPKFYAYMPDGQLVVEEKHKHAVKFFQL